MCRIINSILAVTAAGALSGAAVGSSRTASLEGVWQAVEVTTTGPGARTIRQVPPNLSIITEKHYSHIEIHSDAPRPVLADMSKASADELRQVWGPFMAEAGNYELARGTFTTRAVVAKNPSTMSRGSFTTYGYRLAGDTLWLTTQRNERGQSPNPSTIKLVRVE